MSADRRDGHDSVDAVVQELLDPTLSHHELWTRLASLAEHYTDLSAEVFEQLFIQRTDDRWRRTLLLILARYSRTPHHLNLFRQFEARALVMLRSGRDAGEQKGGLLLEILGAQALYDGWVAGQIADLLIRDWVSPSLVGEALEAVAGASFPDQMEALLRVVKESDDGELRAMAMNSLFGYGWLSRVGDLRADVSSRLLRGEPVSARDWLALGMYLGRLREEIQGHPLLLQPEDDAEFDLLIRYVASSDAAGPTELRRALKRIARLVDGLRAAQAETLASRIVPQISTFPLEDAAWSVMIQSDQIFASTPAGFDYLSHTGRQHPDAGWRATALLGLSMSSLSESAFGVLVEAAEHDHEPAVREAAWRALDLLATMQEEVRDRLVYLIADRWGPALTQQTRLDLVGSLAGFGKSSARARQVVESLCAQDPSAEVRAAAQEALSDLRSAE